MRCTFAIAPHFNYYYMADVVFSKYYQQESSTLLTNPQNDMLMRVKELGPGTLKVSI
jgi:hypothetical protein